MKYLLSIVLGFSILYCISACSGGQKQNDMENQNTMEGSQTDRKTILFYGNSLTAGYGLEEEEAFPGLIQKRLDSLGWPYQVINGGLSGETTASGVTRLDWFLEEKPDIFLLELGANDGLRGIPLTETEKNLRQILDKVHQKYPGTIRMLAGMEIPPNMGPDYTSEFRAIYPKIAKDYPEVIYIPFLLEGVGGNPELNLPDGIHPTAEGHEIVAETVWRYLAPILDKEL